MMGKLSRGKQDRDKEEKTPRQQFQDEMMLATMEDLRRKGQSCILCGTHCHNPAIWFPPASLSRSLGAPEGKYRACAYTICNVCLTKPDYMNQVEEAIMSTPPSN